jgi:ABC-2 type transport system ATP-binding protein
MSTIKEPAISARNLVREYEPGRGVCGVDVSVEWGECFALLGRNGSGKTTLSRLLTAEEKPDSGSLEVSGIDVARLRPAERQQHLASLGVAMDTSIHWQKLSGMDNAWFVGSTYGMAPAALAPRLADLFEQAGLREQAEDAVANYSFGMKRKLSLVEALAHDPKILILDEPTSGVDAQFSNTLAEFLATRGRAGKASWIASNDPEWVAQVAGRVAFMDQGKIIAIGTVQELLDEVASYQEISVTLSTGVSISHPEHAGVQSFHQSEKRVTIVADDDPMLVPGLMQNIVEQGATIRAVEVKRASLRDAFLMKTGRDLSA